MSHVITIAQQKGGAGKTTVASHLAVALQQKGRRVAIIDIDPQGSLTYWHKMREERFGEGYTGLTFATVSGWRVASEISRLKKNHDYIIVDSPPHTETEARTAIRSADLIFVPMQPSPTDLWATQATLDLAAAEKIPVKVIVNRITPNSKLAPAIIKMLKHKVEVGLGNRVIFASSLLEGRTATEIAPTSAAAIEVKSIVKIVTDMFEKREPKAEPEVTEKKAKQKEMEVA